MRGEGADPTAAAPVRVTGHSERLVARARRGDRVARATLVEEHMGLVRSIAVRYRGLGLPVEDLVQEGVVGLLAAIERYDPGRGASFSTYAFWRIRAAVTHAVTARGQLVRVPRPVVERRRRVAEAAESLAAAGRAPSVAELATVTSLARAEVVEALAPVRVVSLDRPLADGTPLGASMADAPARRPEAQVVAAERTRALRRALRRLGLRKRTIVSRHFGVDGESETLSTIATDLKLSPERTRALKDEALHELAAELGPAMLV